MIERWAILGMASGELIGCAVFALPMTLAFLFGIYKCVQIARRPTSHTVCILSLLFCLAGLFTIIGSALCFAATAEVGVATVIAGLCVLLGFVFLIAALVLGIVGLVDYRHHAEVLVQGRTQAKVAD